MFFKKKVRKPVRPIYAIKEKAVEQLVEPIKKETKRVKKEIHEAVSEAKIDDYKKKEIPDIINRARKLNGESAVEIKANDIQYSEEGNVED